MGLTCEEACFNCETRNVTMNRRKGISIALVLLIAFSGTIGVFYLLQGSNGGNGVDDGPIVLDPFNKLNWWDIASEISEIGDFQVTLERLTSYGPRYDGSTGYYRSIDYLTARMNSSGLPVEIWGPHESLVAYQEGYGSDNRAIVFGAHLDSYRWAYNAGADQNAAGCAVVMAIANALSQFRLPIDIYYCFFAGNLDIMDPQMPLQELFGAKEVSSQFIAEDVDVMAFYNFDEILYYNPDLNEDERLIVEHENPSGDGYYTTKYLADVLISFMREGGLDIMSPLFEPNTIADHQPFWDRGIPAVHIRSGHPVPIEEDPPPDNTFHPFYNTTQANHLVRAAAATAVYLALKGNGKDTSYRLDRIIAPESSKSLHTVMTNAQTVTIRGEVRSDTEVTITLLNETAELYSTTVSSNFSFTYDSDLIGAFQVRVTNEVNATADINLYLDYTSDIDGNLVLDSDQYTWPAPDPILDWDSDGLSDSDEAIHGTDIFNFDTDNDGAYDGPEVANGLDPLRNDMEEDPDLDTVLNGLELTLGTDPFNNDTDSDLLPDGWEISFFTNPLVNDSHLDPDSDTLTNFEEYLHGADPQSADGDNDGILDVQEIEIGTDPLSEDTDSDGLRDQLEVLEGLDPLTPDYDYDLAPDGPDANPRISLLIVIVGLTLLPAVFGLVYFRKRLV